MYKFKYKEEDHAKELLKNGFTSKHVSSELKILAMYYKQQEKTNEEIKELLCQFCKKYLKGYNLAIHFKIINNAIKFTGKNKLVQIDSVEVSKGELDYISNMDLIHDYKRVIFTLMVLTKLNKSYTKDRGGELKNNEFYFGGHQKFKELVNLSKITFNKTKKSIVKNIHDLIHILDDKGIVKIAGNGNIKLNFMYEIEENDDIEIEVYNFNVIGFYYDYYCGDKKVKKCNNCNIFIRISNNNQRLCKNCSDDNWRNYNAQKQQEYRKKL